MSLLRRIFLDPFANSALERRIRTAEIEFDKAQDLRAKQNPEQAVASFQAIIQSIGGGKPSGGKLNLRRYARVAAAHNGIGLVEFDQNHCAEAIPHFDRAIALRQDLLRLFPKDRENQIYLGGTWCNRGHALADTNPEAARLSYMQSLKELRQPDLSCECSYWDEARQTRWCSQLEALAQILGLHWVNLAPQFIDNAMSGLASLDVPPSQTAAGSL